MSGTAGLKRKNKPDAKETAEILASQGRIDKFLKKNMSAQVRATLFSHFVCFWPTFASAVSWVL